MFKLIIAATFMVLAVMASPVQAKDITVTDVIKYCNHIAEASEAILEFKQKGNPMHDMAEIIQNVEGITDGQIITYMNIASSIYNIDIDMMPRELRNRKFQFCYKNLSKDA